MKMQCKRNAACAEETLQYSVVYAGCSVHAHTLNAQTFKRFPVSRTVSTSVDVFGGLGRGDMMLPAFSAAQQLNCNLRRPVAKSLRTFDCQELAITVLEFSAALSSTGAGYYNCIYVVHGNTLDTIWPLKPTLRGILIQNLPLELRCSSTHQCFNL